MLLATYAASNHNTTIALTSTGVNNRLAQSFKLKRDAPIGMLTLQAVITGSPTGYVYVELYNVSGTTPGGVIDNGTSEPQSLASLANGDLTFYFDRDARPVLDANKTYFVVLRSGNYTYAADNNIGLGCDQTNPHYINGGGFTYDAAWTAISPSTDFCFELYSGRRETVYSRITEVESMTRALTTEGRYSNTSLPITISAALDFEEVVADEIDGWLTGAGIDAPLTAETAQNMVRSAANNCVAMYCELGQRTAGFRSEKSDTRAAAFKYLCHALRNDLAEGGVVADALKESQGGDRLNSALTAGHIDSDERDAYRDDSTIVQPLFKSGMWDNYGGDD